MRGLTSLLIGGMLTGLVLGILMIAPSKWAEPASRSRPAQFPIQSPVSPGHLAPDFTLPSLGLRTVTLSEHWGHKVLLNFFASWCEACREEMPGVQNQFEKHQIHGWVVIGISIMEPTADVAVFRDEFGLTFPIALDVRGEVSRIYEVRGTPTNIVVDVRGYIAERRLGYMSEPEIEDMLASLP